jgi:hypothetical protein
MAIYRKKPGLREAEQFKGFYHTPYPPGVVMVDNGNDQDQTKERYEFYVVTTHGQKTPIEDGDYIVREPDGNGYYPCKPEIFEKEYELVKEDDK